MFRRKVVFYLLILACLTPFASPLTAFALGVVLAFTVGNPYSEQMPKVTRRLMRGSIILVGFGIDLTTVTAVGKKGILWSLAAIIGTFAASFIVSKIFTVNRKTSALVAAGTAISGGDTIAAAARVIETEPDETSVALGIVFILNAVALSVFPLVGHFFDLNEYQFGMWAGLAIPDTSFVVGAASHYGSEALQLATLIKLAKILWIVPVALFFSFLYRGANGNKAKMGIPVFIIFYLLTATIRTYAPVTIEPSIYDALVNLAKAGVTVTLFLIGAGLSREILKKVCIKPLVQGIILWLLISVVSLWAVLHLLL